MSIDNADVVVAVTDLHKTYPKNPVPAVDGLSFGVARGEVFGLLGPNGAGKTTTIGVLTTRVRPTSGSATVCGIDVVKNSVGVRRKLAVVTQRNNLDRSLSIRQNLLFHASYHGVAKKERTARADALLEQFGLAARADDRVDMFSGGQSQQAMIARALMHSPEVLFLDEPSTGLDPAVRLFVWDRVRELKHSGVTVILTTHDMFEAESLADRVGIMDHGHLLALDTPAALMRQLAGSFSLEVVVDPVDSAPLLLPGELAALAGVVRVEPVENTDRTGMRFRLYLETEAASMVAPVARILADNGALLSDLHLGTPSLEDVFITLTGRGLR